MNKATGTPDYEVIWPDGDIYANRNGEVQLALTEARATAQAIGGTWRKATEQPGERLHFYKLTCGHETANLYEWEPGTGHNCRDTGPVHPSKIVRRTRARDVAR